LVVAFAVSLIAGCGGGRNTPGESSPATGSSFKDKGKSSVVTVND
jgi:hypothetical protein